MRRRAILTLSFLIVTALALVACQREPMYQVETSNEVLNLTFEDPASWETGAYPVGAVEPDSTLSISNGRFLINHRAQRNASFTWALGGDELENAVIEVETEQLSEANNNLYGIACRLAADENGDASGYALLISGDGHYGIARVSNRSLTFLLDWHQSSVIRQGQATNTLRAVCIGDYLALYANGEFLGDITDNTYRQAGQVGLLAGVIEDETVNVAFDNLIVSEGRINN